MDTLNAVLLGIVEGVTEFLPVSSTGHLILADALLGYDPKRWEVFNIVIQSGAIMAVLVLYWRTFLGVARGLLARDAGAIAFVRNVAVAFLPAALVGVLLHDRIEAMLGNARLVAVALIVGGVAILLVERFARRATTSSVAAIGLPTALGIGALQCLAMIPGVSRSGATIMGALSLGVERRTAAEFSFFLAVPTMLGATTLQLFKHRHELATAALGEIAIGWLVAFVVAVVVIKLFVGIVSRFGFAPFAWYRIAAGAAALVWMST